jgi:(p)ppGpp synthase/HD superfamily hydrolase
MFLRGNIPQEQNYARMKQLVIKVVTTARKHFLYVQQLKVIEALQFAAEKHRGIYRKDEFTPYLLHVLEVVCILIDLNVLDFKVIVSAIIHDVVEDTDATKKDVHQRFGTSIAKIVELLTKHPNFIRRWGYWILIKNEPDKNIRWRVIVIKFADRIHNMMTLSSMPKHKRASKIKETLEEFPSLYKVLIKTFRHLRKVGVIKKQDYMDLPFRLNSKLIHEMQNHL